MKRTSDDWLDKYGAAFTPEIEEDFEEPIMCRLCLDNVADAGDDTCTECKEFIKEEQERKVSNAKI